MKRYNLLLAIIVPTLTYASLLAQEKTALQPNVTVVGILQASVGKTVELHLSSGEKLGGKVAQVTDNVVHLSNLAGAEFFRCLRRCQRYLGSRSARGRPIAAPAIDV